MRGRAVIAGKGVANPIGQVWSGAMMLDFLAGGDDTGRQAHDAIMDAVLAVLKEGPHTPDLGGTATTEEVGKAIAEKSKSAGVDQVAFDRSGFKYHGRIKALADAARENGLKL